MSIFSVKLPGGLDGSSAVFDIFDEINTSYGSVGRAELHGTISTTEHYVGVLWKGDVAQVDGDGVHVDVVHSGAELKSIDTDQVVGVEVNIVIDSHLKF